MNIELLVKDESVVTSSLNVAGVLEKDHKRVMEDIKKILKTLSESQSPILGIPPEQQNKLLGAAENWFYLDSYISEQNGQEYPLYYMNQDGFTLLVMKYTGKKALLYKLAYIDEFNRMKNELQHKETLEQTQKRIPSPCMAFGKLYGSAVELMDDCMSIQFHDDPFELSDLMRDRTIVMIIRLLDYFRFPKMPSMVELKKMVQFVRMYTGMDFAEKLFYCFENNKLSIPYLMVVLENHTTKEYPGIEFQRAMAQKYLM